MGNLNKNAARNENHERLYVFNKIWRSVSISINLASIVMIQLNKTSLIFTHFLFIWEIQTLAESISFRAHFLWEIQNVYLHVAESISHWCYFRFQQVNYRSLSIELISWIKILYHSTWYATWNPMELAWPNGAHGPPLSLHPSIKKLYVRN